MIQAEDAIIARSFDHPRRQEYNDRADSKGAPLPVEISEEVFSHLVELALLRLTPEEARALRVQLNEQLKSIRELEDIEVSDDVPITSHGVPYARAIRPPLRADDPKICDEADDILDQAPSVQDRYIGVPDLPTEDLE